MGGRSSTQANTSNQQITTTNVGDIGLTGADAVNLANVITNATTEQSSRLFDSFDRLANAAGQATTLAGDVINSTKPSQSSGFSVDSQTVLIIVAGVVLLGVLS